MPGKAIGKHHDPMQLAVPFADQQGTDLQIGPALIELDCEFPDVSS